jgi:hypothetical protein
MENLNELSQKELVGINGGILKDEILFLYRIAQDGFSFGQWFYHAVND